MYTGIVQRVTDIIAVDKKTGLNTLIINFNKTLLNNLTIGASVAVDGVCLTVTTIDNNKVSFDVMKETLNKTTLGLLNAGDNVNIERSAKQGDEIGGHILSGHVEGTATIANIKQSENNYMIDFNCPAEWMKYILPKGCIAINGASLTIIDTQSTGGFNISLIPETLRATTFKLKQLGDRVNIEIDNQTKVIVTTVERYLQEHPTQ
ncbi:MAG: riboflavin synthase subunit alpha [Methylococcales bacterium]|nr:riboflavin synthase subunit alpha [Methylococcales bacterium]